MGFLRDCGVATDELMITSGVVVDVNAPLFVNTAGAVTYTAENLLRGIFTRDPNGASRADVFPTAALFVAAVASKYGIAKVGEIIELLHVNGADAAETITMTLGAGMTAGPSLGTQVSAAIGQNASRVWKFRLTNVTAASEAVVVYA